MSEASDRQGRRRVVLLDDNPFVRETYRALLGESGWDVRCAANAEEAIAIVGLDGVDALLVDVQMAGRDGLAVLEALARWHPHLLRRVALHTGYADEDRVRSTAGLYGVVLLEKPCRAETLLATLDALASS